MSGYEGDWRALTFTVWKRSREFAVFMFYFCGFLLFWWSQRNSNSQNEIFQIFLFIVLNVIIVRRLVSELNGSFQQDTHARILHL